MKETMIRGLHSLKQRTWLNFSGPVLQKSYRAGNGNCTAIWRMIMKQALHGVRGAMFALHGTADFYYVFHCNFLYQW